MAERYVSFEDSDVLEIGCGSGRLTFQYAALAKSVVAIDPSAKAIAQAKNSTPKNLARRLNFHVGRGERLSFPNESFDLAFFTWSLCCTDIPAMGKALDEAWRVLRQKGMLANIQPSLHQPFRRGLVSYLIDRNSGPSIEDEADRQARLALRHASLVERRFDFIAEEEFPVYTYYDTVDDALEQITAQRRENYRALDRGTRRRIREIITSMVTKKGVRSQENAVLTILRKVSSVPTG